MSFEELATNEHQQLARILEDVAVLTERASYVQSAQRFGELRRMVERHITAEERVVLPLFIERTGGSADIVAQLRNEHIRILHLIDGVGSAISGWDRTGFGNAVIELREALRAHDATEALVLHPALNDVIATAMDWRCLCAAAGVDC